MSLVLLTLAAPRALEEELMEQLLAHPEWASGFTLSHAEGHGHRHERLSVQEQVRGRAARVRVEVVLEARQAEILVAHMKQHLPRPDVAWWIVPVAEFGRLA